MNEYVVVSLFDGLSGGRIALSRTPKIKVLRYYSSEIDKYAIQIADKNYPEDAKYRLGSVTDIDGIRLRKEILEDFTNAKILLIGGSPCQGFSLAGKLKGSSTECGIDVTSLDQYLKLKADDFRFNGQSYLFWEYIRLAYELEVDNYLLENVRVTKQWLPMFNEAMGVEPTRINSSLLSAQNRDRYYWHNFGEIPQPKDKNLIMRDILEPHTINFSGRTCELLEFSTKSTCHHAANATDIKGNESIKRVYADSGKSPTVTTCQGGHREPKVLCGAARGRYLVDSIRQDAKGQTEQILEVRSDGKTNCLTTTTQKDPNVYNGAYYRKLTSVECERLQTLPDNYTEGVSDTQRRKMIGNGWTIDVVSYILTCLEN